MQLLLGEDEIASRHFIEICEGKVLLRKDGTERMAAVKLVSPKKHITEADLEEVRESLLHEARCLRDLADHSHIVKCLGITSDTFRVMLALELMSGSLLERLRAKPTMTVESKTNLGELAASALVHIHCHGMVHRNVCATNCLVSTIGSGETKNLKLTGFDFCEKLDADDDYVDKNTPPLNIASCAPEALAKKTWSRASDVWSFAVLIVRGLHEWSRAVRSRSLEGAESQSWSIVAESVAEWNSPASARYGTGCW